MFQYVNYSDFKSHLEKCKFRIYHCENQQCKKEGLLPQMEEHIKICKFRKIDWEKCKAKIIAKDNEDHLNKDCPEMLVKCPFCDKKWKEKIIFLLINLKMLLA